MLERKYGKKVAEGLKRGLKINVIGIDIALTGIKINIRERYVDQPLFLESSLLRFIDSNIPSLSSTAMFKT